MKMRLWLCSHFLALAWCAGSAGATELITVDRHGSIRGHFPGTNAPLTVLRLSLPTASPAELRREGGALRGIWVANGIRYTLTVLLTSIADGRPNFTPAFPVLLVNLEGENTAAEYADARAELVLERQAMPTPLRLKEGSVWYNPGESDDFLGLLEIPESGIRVSQGPALKFAGAIPPSIKGSMTLKIPLGPSDRSQPVEELADLDFEREIRKAFDRTGPQESASIPVTLAFASEPGADARLEGSNFDAPCSIPSWFPQAPALPPPQGDVMTARTPSELVQAIEQVTAGGTVLIADGEYALPRVLVLQEKRNVSIRGQSGDARKVILRGQGWSTGSDRDDILHIRSCDGVTIADLTFADCRSYGIKVEAETGPRNLHIYACHFRDIGVRALKGSAGQDPAVRAVNGSVQFCTFENTRVPPADWLFGGDYISAIDMMALENWSFSDNIFRNIRGRRGGGRAAIFIWVRSRRITVERNLILNCDRGIAFGNPGQSTANRPDEVLTYVAESVIRNNMITGGPDCGVELWHADQIQVLHNSIWRPEQNWARGIRVGTGTRHCVIRNNLVHGAILLDGGNAEQQHNLTGRFPHYFVDPACGNLALTREAKQALDAGEILPTARTDIRGQTREGRADLGAWELRQ